MEASPYPVHSPKRSCTCTSGVWVRELFAKLKACFNFKSYGLKESCNLSELVPLDAEVPQLLKRAGDSVNPNVPIALLRKNYGSRSKKGEIPRFELSHNALNRKPQK